MPHDHRSSPIGAPFLAVLAVACVFAAAAMAGERLDAMAERTPGVGSPQRTVSATPGRAPWLPRLTEPAAPSLRPPGVALALTLRPALPATDGLTAARCQQAGVAGLFSFRLSDRVSLIAEFLPHTHSAGRGCNLPNAPRLAARGWHASRPNLSQPASGS